MTLTKRSPPSSPQHILAGAHGIDTGVGRLVAWPPALLRVLSALWHKTKLRAVGPGNTRPIQSRYLMGISLPSSVPACLLMTRMPTHCGLASSSAGPSLQVMGLTPAFLLCTQEPWLCFGRLEVLVIYIET